MKRAISPRLKEFSTVKQRRLDELLEKNSEGTITRAEKTRLEQLVAEAEHLMVVNAQRVARFSRGRSAAVPPGAVPVTVWVSPEQTRR